jgi:hypothetical protein
MNTFSIHLGGFVLTEPTTAFTDLILACICLYVILRLGRSLAGSKWVKGWQFFFAGMGLSTLTGVLVHGLRNYFSVENHYLIWMSMNIISGTSVCFAQYATRHSVLLRSKNGGVYSAIAAAQAVAYFFCLLLIRPFSFTIVIIQVAIGMLPVMALNFLDFSKGAKGGAWLGTGIALTFVAAVFRVLKVSVSEHWFNFNDIGHVFIGASFLFICKGILLREVPGSRIAQQ